jgi:hypothetical protein
MIENNLGLPRRGFERPDNLPAKSQKNEEGGISQKDLKELVKNKKSELEQAEQRKKEFIKEIVSTNLARLEEILKQLEQDLKDTNCSKNQRGERVYETRQKAQEVREEYQNKYRNDSYIPVFEDAKIMISENKASLDRRLSLEKIYINWVIKQTNLYLEQQNEYDRLDNEFQATLEELEKLKLAIAEKSTMKKNRKNY